MADGLGVSFILRMRASRKVCSSNLRPPGRESSLAQKSTSSFKSSSLSAAVTNCRSRSMNASCSIVPVIDWIGAFSRSISTVFLTTSFRPTINRSPGKI